MDWTKLLQELLYIVFTIAIPIVLKYLIPWLKEKANEITINIDNETLSNYIESAIDVIGQSVVYVNQTFVDSLKAQGKFTEESANEAFEKAKNTALILLTDEMKSAIEIMYGDFETYIDTKIEELVHYNKFEIE